MAKTLSKPRSILFILFTIFFFSTYAIADEAPVFSKNLPPSSLGLNQQKLSHLHFYFHDIVSGPKPTAVRVAQAATTNKSPTEFGAVAVIDDPLTLLPENTSKVVGQAQGIYTLASQSEAALLMVLNFAFTEGEYNGSTLSVLGRNTVFSNVREMPIVGGSGVFRFAQGEYNGSTLSVLGRNTVFSNVREMPIVGGSGVFRFARGYAQAKTYTFDTKSGDAVVEYNVYVLHY
ncbi:dirigent protein 21 [Quercus suber]|uniref:Dirigent protein n=1 Tax=Quercus suber TaxID=58331 RepID=A0AAW0KQC9_QUESU